MANRGLPLVVQKYFKWAVISIYEGKDRGGAFRSLKLLKNLLFQAKISPNCQKITKKNTQKPYKSSLNK